MRNNNKKESHQESLSSPIPQGWQINSVGKAFQICNNLRLPISEEIRKQIQGEYPYYGPTKIQDYINEFRIEGRYALIGEDGDHFLKWQNSPMTLLVDGKFNVNNHAHLIKGKENLTEWFYYYFNHRELTPYLTRQGAGRYKLTKDSLSKIPCLIPPLPEQKLIIALLGTWDKAINIVKLTITQKEKQKKWLMHILLTGKKRLKEFKGKPQFDVLKPFVNEVSERNNDHNIKRVLSVTNSRGFINQTDQFDRVVASDDSRNYKIVRKGQFAYNPSRINVGSLDLLKTFDSGILSPMYIVFETRDHKILPDFLYYQLKSKWFAEHIPMFVQGSVRDSLSFDALCGIKFFIPTIEEQAAIIAILSTADKQLSLLQQSLEQRKMQKKGLMQILLTGKKRILYKK